jgi:hypothetical protein
MRTKLTILLLALTIQPVFCQRFNKLFVPSDYDGLNTSVIELDSSYIMSVNVTNSTNKIYFYKLDKITGDTLKTKAYILPYQYYYSGDTPTMCKTSDNDFIFINGGIDGNQLIELLKINENLDTLWLKKIYMTGYIYNSVNKNDTLYITGSKNDSLLYLAEINSLNGNIIKDTSFVISPGFTNVIGRSIFFTSNNEILICGHSYEKGFIVRLDSSWNIKWKKLYSQAHFLYTITEMNDGNLLVGGYAFYMYNPIDHITPYFKCYLWKLTSDGNIIWGKKYGFTGHYSGVSTFFKVYPYKNNTYLAIGSTDTTYYHEGSGYMVCVTKDGDELWHRYFYAGSILFGLDASSVIKTSNNGYLIAGMVENGYDYNFYNGVYKPCLIGIDSIGRDDWGSDDTLIHYEIKKFRLSDGKEINSRDTLCYGERVKVEFTLRNAVDSNDYHVDIYWNDGWVCNTEYLDENIVATYKVKPNIKYTYITDPAPAVPDLCQSGHYDLSLFGRYKYGPFITLGYEATTFRGGMYSWFYIDTTCVIGVPETALESNKLKLYPNPATEFITLESERLMNGKLYIINNLGLVVKEEEVKQTNEKTLSIRNLPAGLYLLKYNSNIMRFSIVK